MYDNIFKRVEEKYLLNSEEREKFLNQAKEYIQEDDKYFKSTVCSIYFDTDNSDFIVNSLEKPIFKEKIRLRSYGIPNLEDDVFLELKVKYKEIVGKRRIKMKLNEFYEYLEGKEYNKSSQIMKEIDYYFKRYCLKPAIFIGYDRESYQGAEDNNLRITMDQNLRSRRTDLKLELGDDGEKFFKEDLYLMEIKTLGSLPLWLVKILSESNIYPISFSKYGKIYMKEKEEKERLIC